eukprot:scaffold149350_cov16-Tisochrysis_lutea.AAC.1
MGSENLSIRFFVARNAGGTNGAKTPGIHTDGKRPAQFSNKLKLLVNCWLKRPVTHELVPALPNFAERTYEGQLANLKKHIDVNFSEALMLSLMGLLMYQTVQLFSPPRDNSLA